MRLPEKTVLPMPRRPGLISFRGKNAVWACMAAAMAKSAGIARRGTDTILAWKAMEPQMDTDAHRFECLTKGRCGEAPGSRPCSSEQVAHQCILANGTDSFACVE